MADVVVDVTADSMTDCEVVGDSHRCNLDFCNSGTDSTVRGHSLSHHGTSSGAWAMTEEIRNRLKVTRKEE